MTQTNFSLFRMVKECIFKRSHYNIYARVRKGNSTRGIDDLTLNDILGVVVHDNNY